MPYVTRVPKLLSLFRRTILGDRTRRKKANLDVAHVGGKTISGVWNEKYKTLAIGQFSSLTNYSVRLETTDEARLLAVARILDTLFEDNLAVNPEEPHPVEGGYEALVRRLIRKGVIGEW